MAGTDDSQFMPPERPTRKRGQHPTATLTIEAYVRLRRELEYLKTDWRRHMSERLLAARELGDIRENAEYDAAKNEQGLMEARIRNLEHQLKDPEIIEATDSDEVSPGTVVTLRPQDDDAAAEDDDERYLVAASAEERAKGVRTVTTNSPLGAQLIGKRVGDRVTYEAPGGVFTYEVVALEPYRPA
jgi:transcription elongation factor GreA